MADDCLRCGRLLCGAPAAALDETEEWKVKLCDRCRVPGCLLDYGGKACQEARKKYCPDVVFTHADKIREMDDEALAFIIMCPRDDGNKCKNCGDVITCIACCLDWLRESAEG